MTHDRTPAGNRPRRIRLLAVVCAAGVAVVTTALLAGFHTELHPITPDEPNGARSELVTTEKVGIRTFTPPAAGVTVDPDVVYGTQGDGTLLTLDVCSPPTDETISARPAVLSIHGGSWARGDKGNSDWRAVCQWLASEGFVAFSVNYRLAPAATFPAAIDDVSLALEWIRSEDNAEAYGVDPDRIGVFGGSAGGNLAALLGARGTGSLIHGSRVAAVAELSAPVDLDIKRMASDGTAAGLRLSALAYLGCAAELDDVDRAAADCPQAHEASATSELDASDPPVFIGASDTEYVPLSQSERYAAELAKLGIRHELVTVPGTLHSIGILDEAMRARVAAFLHSALGA
ncbi:alpha/beta hydrolase [Glaciibacter sp. 2TAF33]|uniref:alpha/beta hydrolase n=1 Tax=Glaciibacter sp. 2TAF33 TaxID=3233015 RepID=UPI003F8DFEC4